MSGMIETWINELTNQTALSTNDYLILIQNLNELVENEHLCWSFLSLIFMLSSGFIRSWHVPLQLTAVTRRIINSSSSTTVVCSHFFIVFCEACARGTWPKRVAPNVPTFRAYRMCGSCMSHVILSERPCQFIEKLTRLSPIHKYT